MDRAEILAWRRVMRAVLIEQRMALAPAAHHALGAAIEQRLRPLLAASPDRLIGAYWPFRHEFNVLPLLEKLIADGRAVALPVVVGKDRPLEFRRWTKDTKLASGVYDIPYPAEGDAVEPTALIVALVGFDDAGYRLGYGGGFYDRTIVGFAKKPFCVGVGFAAARLATIHPLPHDIPMDAIVTEAAAYRRGPGGLEEA